MSRPSETRRLRLPRLALAVVAVVSLVLGPALLAGAAEGEPVDVGWWTRNPGQSAPAGGFAVATAPDGAVTVAAVTIEMSDDVRIVVLDAVETGGVGQGSAGVVVCPTVAGWEAASGGALADAPEPDCETASVAFERDAESSTWSADISALVVGRSGLASVALVPASDAGPLTAFDVRFAAPTTKVTVEVSDSGSGGSSFDGTGGGEPAGGFDGGTASPTPDSSPSFSGGFDAGGFDPGPTVEPDTDEPATGDVADPPPSTVPALETPSDESAFQPLAPAAISSTPSHRTVGKAIQYVAMSALAGVVVGGGSRLARSRRLSFG